jgi:hypothetical protein
LSPPVKGSDVHTNLYNQQQAFSSQLRLGLLCLHASGAVQLDVCLSRALRVPATCASVFCSA